VAGTIDVTVITLGGTTTITSADQFAFVTAGTPTITAVSPTIGETYGGAVVTVTGTRLTGTQNVYFGNIPATQFTVESDTSIAVTAPPETAGTVDISIVTPTGTSPLLPADQFTYTDAPLPTVTGVSPNTGLTGGGQVVTINGTNLLGATVFFGSIPSQRFLSDTSTSIIAVSPCQAAGTVDVTVVTTASSTPSGTSSSDHFTYTLATPTVTGVTPNVNVSPNTWVTVTGTNLLGASAVYVGTTSMEFGATDDNSLQMFIPFGLTGTFDVTVTTAPSITSSTTSADQISVNTIPVPTITSISTSTGSTAGGTQIVLTGTGFIPSVTSV
jgi:hypothetical protein